ncbi:hypothetical protein ILUMI_11337 [Ignelater luminosus]|uniref:Galectin n=1 Tax=Ignelater luminosus TaxID=2038154 RepID=A0A8K0D0F6_IGNLU|nr:hypothetical protein ILUMI_11337 [Ignelater luminosus]
MQPITNPPVPYIGPIRGGFNPGTMVRIQGQAPPNADRFNINLHCGQPPSDIALHISVRLLQNYIARNSFEDGAWGSEEDNGSVPIAPGQRFEILILCDPGSYKVAINGNHFCEFRHRIPFQKVDHLAIDGDVALGLISFESGASAPPPGPPYAGGPDYAYGPPPGQYGPPPQQGYGPPPPYGSGPPRPPGHQEESGMDNFLETAGTIIAGALASGAAQNLFSGITGSGGQAQQQQQRYQPPPPPPPQPQQPLFSLGGGQGTVGGLGSVGSLLQTFAGQVLAGPKKVQMPMSAASPLLNQSHPTGMPMPTSVPLPSPSQPPRYSSGPPMPMPNPYMPQMPPYGAPPSYIPTPMPPGGGGGATYPIQPPLNMQNYGPQPIYPHKKMKKSKLKKAMKYGLPIAGAGLGAYAVSRALRHSSSSSSSSSDSD